MGSAFFVLVTVYILLALVHLFLIRKHGRRLLISLLCRVGLVLMMLMLALESFHHFIQLPKTVLVLADTSSSQPLANQAANRTVNLPETLLSQIKNHHGDAEVVAFNLFHASSEANQDLTVTKNSPIASALNRFLQQAQPSVDTPLMLLSDGNDTSPDKERLKLQNTLKSAGLTLDVQPVSRLIEGEDLELAQYANPRVVFLRSQVRLPVTVRHRLDAPRSVHVILTDGGNVLARQILNLPSGEGSEQVVLEFTPQTPGDQLFYLRVTQLEEESQTINNVAYLPMNVRKEKLKVLHIAGRPSWDLKALRRLMRNTPGLDMISFFILRDPIEDQNFVSEKDLALIQFPVDTLFVTELMKFDLIVFHNFAIQKYLTQNRFRTSFQDFLASGKRIIVIGGEQVLQQQAYQKLFLNPGEQFSNLPVSLEPDWPGMFQHLDQFQELAQQNSFTLLNLFQPSAESTPPIKRTYFKKGYVDWVMTPSLWRSNFGKSISHQGFQGHFASWWHMLIQQSEAEVLSDFRQDQPFDSHQAISGVVRLDEIRQRRLPRLVLQVEDLIINQIIWEKNLPTDQPSVVASLPPLNEGTYRLKVTCHCDSLSEQTQLIVVTDDWMEKRFLKPDLDFLQALATASGGKVLQAVALP